MDRRGEGLVEVFLLIVLVAIIVIVIVALLGPDIIEFWNQLKMLFAG